MASNCTVAPFRLRPNKLTKEPGARARAWNDAALATPAVTNWGAFAALEIWEIDIVFPVAPARLAKREASPSTPATRLSYTLNWFTWFPVASRSPAANDR